MAGGTTITGGWNVVNPPKFYEEAATGYASAIAAANANGVFGKSVALEVEVDPGTNQYRALGSEDVYSQIIGKVGIRGRLRFGLTNESTAFINYCNKANANASGDISRAIHVVWSQKTWETGSTFATVYFALRGVKPNRLSVRGAAGTPLEGEVEFISHSLTFTGGATYTNFVSTFAAEPTGDPWNFEDGGVNPITLGGVIVDCTNFEWSVDRDLKPVYVLGTSTLTFLFSGNRSVSGTFTEVHRSGSSFLDTLTATAQTLSWVMKTGAGTFSAASTVLTGHSIPVDIATETYQNHSWVGGTTSTM